MTGSSGIRIASLSCALLGLLVSSAWADAGVPAAGGASGSDTTNEHEEAESTPDEETSENEAVEEAPAPPQVEAPQERPPPPMPAANQELGDLLPGRRDFLRRLRTTAENIEQVRNSEKTRAHTDGDLTVLSNVDPSPEATPPEAPVAEAHADPGTRDPVDVEEVAPPEKAVEEASSEVALAKSRTNVKDDAPSGPWHWLWILGGVATVLLVPIAMLLTRATRSS